MYVLLERINQHIQIYPKSLTNQLIKKDVDFTDALIENSEDISLKRIDILSELKDSYSDEIIGFYIGNLRINIKYSV
jgi:hypothetical protein